MPELAQIVTVSRHPTSGGVRINIDGREFPWYTGPGGVVTNVSQGENPALTVVIPCESLLIEDSVG